MTTEPPTTPPTTEHSPDTEYDAADLLADDGTVDVGAVKSITNAQNTTEREVSPQQCRQFRRAVRRGTQPRNVDTAFNQATVRKHATGQCHHDHGAPTAEYDADAEQWVCSDG